MTTDTHKEIDLLDAVRPVFEAGKGVILMQRDMPDAALLLAIKQAAAFGKPFTVVPPIEIEVVELEKHAGSAGGVIG